MIKKNKILGQVSIILISCFVIACSNKQQASCSKIPLNEITLDEFMKCEESKDADIVDNNNNPDVVFSPLSEQLYPYTDKYSLSQPIKGERVDSGIRTSFSMRYDESTDTVKYIDYSISPKIPSIDEVTQQVYNKYGDFNEKEFTRLRESVYDSTYMKKLSSAYEYHKSYLDEYATRVENRKFPEDYPLENLVTYKINSGYYELAYELIEKQRRVVNLTVYWE